MADPRLTALLERLRGGDLAARDELLPFVYAGLYGLARKQMARQSPSHTLQPTALVHEAWLRLSRDADWGDQTTFLGVASTVMRQILVDHARRKRALKRGGGGGERLELDALTEQLERSSGGLVELDEALSRLRQRDPDLTRLIELRFFAGCTLEEAAGAIGISVRQASRWWAIGRAVLRRDLDAR